MKTLTLIEVFQQYQDKRLPLGSNSTFHQFDINLARFSEHLGRAATVADLTDAAISKVMVAMIKSGLAVRTANKFRENMLAIWRFLSRRGDLTRWPEVENFAEPLRIPTAWTKTQLKRLWKACERQPGMIGDVPARLYWLTLTSVIWDSAERIGGCLSIRWDDVDLCRRWLIVRAEGRKGKRADKATRLHRDTVQLLKSIQRPIRDLVFEWPYDHGYLWTRYKHVLQSAKLPTGRLRGFHCLRKSAASYFEAAGGNAQELLGHADGRTTKRHYLDPRIVSTTHAADVLFRPAG